MKCTIYKNIYTFKEPFHISVEKALKRIKKGSSKEIVEILRNELDQNKQDAIKKTLPCIVFSGVFSARRDDMVSEYTNLIILDFDYVSDVFKEKEILTKNPYIYACWISPRGNGLKALVKIADGKKHKEHFLALEKEFENLDIIVFVTLQNVYKTF